MADEMRSADPDGADAGLAAAGDVAAFERLYRRHAARVYSLARRMLGAPQAEDATQEIFLRAWSKLPGFRGEGAFGAWLGRLGRNMLLSRLQARRPEDSVSTGALQAVPRAPELAMDLEAAIERLPEGARQVLVLRDVEGYSHEDVAAFLGISTGTSKSQLHRARTLLRGWLEGGPTGENP